MENTLSSREGLIGQRLREFREHLLISRAVFAREIGIGAERLASYESGRAPLRYDIFQKITGRFFLSPYWLATGKGRSSWGFPFNDSHFGSQINPLYYFTTVYDQVLSALFDRSAKWASEMEGKIFLLWTGFDGFIDKYGATMDEIGEGYKKALVDTFCKGLEPWLGPDASAKLLSKESQSVTRKTKKPPKR